MALRFRLVLVCIREISKKYVILRKPREFLSRSLIRCEIQLCDAFSKNLNPKRAIEITMIRTFAKNCNLQDLCKW